MCRSALQESNATHRRQWDRFNTEIGALQQKLDAANHRIEQLQAPSDGLTHFGTISFTPGGPETTVYAPTDDARARRITNVHKPVTGIVTPVKPPAAAATATASASSAAAPPAANGTLKPPASTAAAPKPAPELAQKKPFLYI
jgi:hypothetical protein